MFGAQICPSSHQTSYRLSLQIILYITQTHDTNPTDWFCHECCTVFYNRDELNTHKKALKHHKQIRKHVVKPSKRTRMTMKQNKQRKHYFCEHNGCHKAFDRLEYFNKHQKTHFKPFMCSLCHYRGSSKNDLIIHQRTHSNKRTEKCTFCGNAFKDPAALRKHIKYIHFSGVQCKPFVCRKCKKSFARKESLQIHWVTHGKNKTMFPCDQCESTFTLKSNYTKHKRLYH
eukprot:681944_1